MKRFTAAMIAAAGLGLPAAAQAVSFSYQELDGIVLGEGEVFTSRADDGSGNGWRIVPDESAGAGTLHGARGSYVQSLPDNGSGGGPTTPPSISYQVQINTPGTYQLYVRWANNQSVGGGGNSDSMFADLVEFKDGVGTGQADWYEMTANRGTFEWDAGGQAEINLAGAADHPMTWDITTPGTYTVRFSQREDGSAVDAWALRLNSVNDPTLFTRQQTSYMVQVEAENYDARGDEGSGLGWKLVDATAGDGNVGNGEYAGDPNGNKYANASNGQYMQVGDEGAFLGDDNGLSTGPYLDYNIHVDYAGHYQLFARWDSHDGASDSLYAQILEIADGEGGEADWYRFSALSDSDFDADGWQGTAAPESHSAGGGDQKAMWYLTPGDYTMRFKPREDGVALDAFRMVLVVPEPASLSLLALPLLAWRGRRNHTA